MKSLWKKIAAFFKKLFGGGSDNQPAPSPVPAPEPTPNVDPGVHNAPYELSAEIPIVWPLCYSWFNELGKARQHLGMIRKIADECGQKDIALCLNLAGALGIPKKDGFPNCGTKDWRGDFEKHVKAFVDTFFPACEECGVAVVIDFENGNNMEKGYKGSFTDDKRGNILYYYKQIEALRARVEKSPWFLGMLVWSEPSKSGLGSEEAYWVNRYVAGLQPENGKNPWPARKVCACPNAYWTGDRHIKDPATNSDKRQWSTSDNGPAIESMFDCDDWMRTRAVPKVAALENWARETRKRGVVSRLYIVAPWVTLDKPNRDALAAYLRAWAK